MTDQNQEFRPEMVEEQLEQLANDLHNLSQAAEPEKRMVQQLYRLYQANRKDDAASVERVWQRLQQKLKQDQIGIIHEKQSESITELRRQPGRSTMIHNREWHSSSRRTLEVLVAIVVVGMIVGSLLVLINFTRHSNNPANQQNHAPITHTIPQGATKIAGAATPTPVPAVTTTCPAAGTARNAVMPPLPVAGHDQNIVYVYTQPDAGVNASSTSILRKYDITTGIKTDILKLMAPNSSHSIDAAQVSPDGQWVAFLASNNAVQLVRVDGQEQQTLYCPGITTQYDLAWSPDQRYLAFSEISNSPQGLNLDILDTTNGQIHVGLKPSRELSGYSVIKWADDTSMYVTEALVGVGNTNNQHGLYLLKDVREDASQQATNLQKIDLPSIPGASGDLCQAFDVSPNHSQLLYSDCSLRKNAMGATALGGPGVIVTQAVTGGELHTIYSNPNYAIPYSRFISNTTVLFLIDDLNAGSHNGLWKINVDGTGLARLSTEAPNALSGTPVLSSDGRMYALSVTGFTTSGSVPPSLVFGSLNGSAPTTFARASSPQESIQVAGWTTE